MAKRRTFSSLLLRDRGWISNPTPTNRDGREDGKSVLSGNARVLGQMGGDVSEMFVEGAKKVVDYAQKNKVKIAILTDGSPSCGSTYVYDGTFTGRQVVGKGVAAELMEQNGIRVFGEDKINEALDFLNKQ